MQRYAEQQGLLGSLRPGQKKLEGKTFYLDGVKKRPTALLLEAVSLLGGAVESFLHRDVSFVVTGSQEFLKDPKCPDIKPAMKMSSEEAQHPIKTRESVPKNDKRQSMACGSRGKALLEKAIRNKEQLQRSSVLANAQSWGVKILYVDDVLLYLKRLSRESFSTMNKKPEKPRAKQAPHVKAAALRSPFLKIEDSSRKYRPLHMQSMIFPSLWYSGCFSPFEAPPPPRFDQRQTNTKQRRNLETSLQDESGTRLSCTPSPWRPRKKDLSFCECCHQPFARLEEHLQSDQHRAFVLDVSSYCAVDECIAQMLPGFDPEPSEETPDRRRFSSVPDACELEPLSDVETELAVQALQRHGSSDSVRVASPTGNPLADPFPDPGPPPAELQPLTPDTDPPPFAPSPTMPVLCVEAHAGRQPPCSSPDPYSLPPVLSPHPAYILEPHSPYSEPPVLSPQRLHPAGGAEDEFQSVPAAPVSAWQPHGWSRGGPEVTHPCRSRSLPRPPPAAPNPKKRCRSASPERNKRRRVSGRCGWTEPGRTDAAHPEAGSSADQVSCDVIQSCSGTPSTRPAAFKQTLTTSGGSFTPRQTDDRGHGGTGAASLLSWPPSTTTNNADPPLKLQASLSPQDPQQSLSTSVCIESALIPDLCSQSSSDSDWDRHLLSRLAPAAVEPLLPGEPDCELDKERLHRPGAWMQDAGYESRLDTVLQPSNQGAALCGEEMDASGFSRTVVQIVEVQH